MWVIGKREWLKQKAHYLKPTQMKSFKIYLQPFGKALEPST